MRLKRSLDLASQALLFGVILAILVYRYDLYRKMELVINISWVRELVYVSVVKALSYLWITRAKISKFTMQVLVIDLAISSVCLGIYLMFKYGSILSGGVPLAFIFDIAEKSLVALGLLLFFKASDT